MNNLKESDFLILDPSNGAKKNMAEKSQNGIARLLLQGSQDLNWYKTTKYKKYALGIYTKTSTYTKKYNSLIAAGGCVW